MDGLLDKYLGLLATSTDKGKVLSMMYGEMFEVGFDLQTLLMFKKLVKLYGYQRILSCMMDMYDMEISDKKNVYGLLSYLLKKKVSEQVKRIPDTSLVDHVKQVEAKFKEHGRLIE